MTIRFVHASASAIGEKAVLILGESGAGKSALAEKLIAEAEARGYFARLIGDDRIGIRPIGGRLLASPHPAIAGRIERRGVGIADVPFLDGAVITGVIMLEIQPARMPEAASNSIEIEGIALPVLRLRDDHDLAAKAHLVLAWLNA